jgi:hypothetical protein
VFKFGEEDKIEYISFAPKQEAMSFHETLSSEPGFGGSEGSLSNLTEKK